MKEFKQHILEKLKISAYNCDEEYGELIDLFLLSIGYGKSLIFKDCFNDEPKILHSENTKVGEWKDCEGCNVKKMHILNHENKYYIVFLVVDNKGIKHSLGVLNFKQYSNAISTIWQDKIKNYLMKHA